MNTAVAEILMINLSLFFSILAFPLWAHSAIPPDFDRHPPRIRALLEQGWALETGSGGQIRDHAHAAALYCEAARHGSTEGHFRSGLIYLKGDPTIRTAGKARAFLAIALEQGHPGAEQALLSIPNLVSTPLSHPDCLDPGYIYTPQTFDLAAYIRSLRKDRHEIAQLITRLAPEYGIDRRLALAIAAVESNFDPRAVSPKKAQGVMQLMPDTARRFDVRNPFDPEQNIRGGLAYLRWLSQRFSGNLSLVVAAFNAGEGAVQRHGGPPPYLETRSYLARVIKLSQTFH